MIVGFPPTSMLGLIGKYVEMEFEVEGAYPEQVMVTWYKDGSPLNINNTRYHFSPDYLTLTISLISYTDEGQYTITVHNDAGSNSIGTMLKVEGERNHCMQRIISIPDFRSTGYQ